jgi:2-methylaconitate cis-trans-isomerase PrpF
MMMGQRIKAAFVRGGTSKGLIFRAEDLPGDRSHWDTIFLQAMGSPDPYGRQLDGMGGGISSLSKVCVVSPPTRPDADIDYLFAQVQVAHAAVDYGGNCGNMSAAIGPFAVDEGLVQVADGHATVRIHNVNTGKIIRAGFEVRDGASVQTGDFTMSGVAGASAPVTLEFLDLGGAATGTLLPTGEAVSRLDGPSGTVLMASLVDAANPCAFFRAADFGLTGAELPDEIEAVEGMLERLEDARRRASVAMRIASSYEEAAAGRAVPLLALVSAPLPYRSLSGQEISPATVDVLVRFVSSGRLHRAIPVTGGLCTAVAAGIEGSLVHTALGGPVAGRDIRIGTPSGVFSAAARVRNVDGAYRAEHAAIVRTSRRLFDGGVYL